MEKKQASLALREQLTLYMEEKSLRKTPERYEILRVAGLANGIFTIDALMQRLGTNANYLAEVIRRRAGVGVRLNVQRDDRRGVGKLVGDGHLAVRRLGHGDVRDFGDCGADCGCGKSREGE